MREVSFMWAQQTWQWFQELAVVSWALILFLSVFGFFSASQWTEMFEPNPSWHRRLSGPCDIFAYSGKQKHSMNIIKEPLRIREYCRLHIAFFQHLPCSLSSSLHLFSKLSSSLLSPSISSFTSSITPCSYVINWTACFGLAPLCPQWPASLKCTDTQTHECANTDVPKQIQTRGAAAQSNQCNEFTHMHSLQSGQLSGAIAPDTSRLCCQVTWPLAIGKGCKTQHPPWINYSQK